MHANSMEDEESSLKEDHEMEVEPNEKESQVHYQN